MRVTSWSPHCTIFLPKRLLTMAATSHLRRADIVPAFNPRSMARAGRAAAARRRGRIGLRGGGAVGGLRLGLGFGLRRLGRLFGRGTAAEIRRIPARALELEAGGG